MPSSHLLRLPTEILRLILEPFLPRTALLRRATTRLKRKPFHDIIWVNRQNKTAISLLLACQRLHDLCSELIYGARNQFVLRTSYEGSVWVFRRLLEFKGLVPTETRRVEDCFGAGGGSLEDLSRLRNRAVWERVRRWCVEVTVEDGYTDEIITPTPRNASGMIKYGYGGTGLDFGVREQVLRLVSLIKQCEDLVAVDVCLDDQEKDPGAAERVLEPFLELKGQVLHGVKIENVRKEFADNVRRVTTLQTRSS